MNTKQIVTFACCVTAWSLAFSTQRAQAQPPPKEPTPFAMKLAEIAKGQYDTYHTLREKDKKLAAQIHNYWTGLGLSFPGVNTAWSAVFVSWCVKQAGAAKDEFKFAAAHSQFVHAAIGNASNNRGVFRGFDIKSYVPKVGDIIQNNRGGTKFNFEFAKQNAAYFSHSAIVVEEVKDAQGNRFVITIGGNEADSVGRKTVKLDANGKIIQRKKDPYICIIQTLK